MSERVSSRRDWIGRAFFGLGNLMMTAGISAVFYYAEEGGTQNRPVVETQSARCDDVGLCSLGGLAVSAVGYGMALFGAGLLHTGELPGREEESYPTAPLGEGE